MKICSLNELGITISRVRSRINRISTGALAPVRTSVRLRLANKLNTVFYQLKVDKYRGAGGVHRRRSDVFLRVVIITTLISVQEIAAPNIFRTRMPVCYSP